GGIGRRWRRRIAVELDAGAVDRIGRQGVADQAVGQFTPFGGDRHVDRAGPGADGGAGNAGAHVVHLVLGTVGRDLFDIVDSGLIGRGGPEQVERHAVAIDGRVHQGGVTDDIAVGIVNRVDSRQQVGAVDVVVVARVLDRVGMLV